MRASTTRLAGALLLGSWALGGCSGGEKSDPALNVPRPAGASRPAAPGVGGGGASAPAASATANEAKL